MKNLIIRKAKIEDLKIIQELSHQLFIHDENSDSTLNMNWSFEEAGESYFKNVIGSENGLCLIAELNGEIVGYLIGEMLKTYPYRKIKKISELGNIFITEIFRSQRIGEGLFEEFVKWSKEKGVERIKVSAYSENIGAIGFYKRIGFVPFTTVLEYKPK
jgi:ribosomal protein S18 acetylase RimI-like enzyme